MRLVTNLKYGAMCLAACIMIMGAAEDCDGKASEASYAGNGETMFTNSAGNACSSSRTICDKKGSGKLRFGRTYSAHANSDADRKHCLWSIFTIDTAGEQHLIKSGTYKTAKVSAAEPTRVQVFLKSDHCGDWK